MRIQGSLRNLSYSSCWYLKQSGNKIYSEFPRFIMVLKLTKKWRQFFLLLLQNNLNKIQRNDYVGKNWCPCFFCWKWSLVFNEQISGLFCPWEKAIGHQIWRPNRVASAAATLHVCRGTQLLVGLTLNCSLRQLTFSLYSYKSSRLC